MVEGMPGDVLSVSPVRLTGRQGNERHLHVRRARGEYIWELVGRGSLKLRHRIYSILKPYSDINVRSTIDTHLPNKGRTGLVMHAAAEGLWACMPRRAEL